MNQDATPKIVKEWFANANEDLRAAKALFQLSSKNYARTVPYLCQQATEKSIKGYLTFKKLKFEKTHDIGKLKNLVLPIQPDLMAILTEADQLTDFAIAFRYPGSANIEATIEDSIFALDIASKVYDTMSSLIPFSSQWDI